MFYYLYHSLPGKKGQKIAISIALIVGILALVFLFVFPWVASIMQPDVIVYRG